MPTLSLGALRRGLGAAILVVSTAIAAIPAPASAASALITEEEARLPDAPSAAPTRGISRGPGVRLSTPDEVTARGFPLQLALDPRGGARIDPDSLKVTYLKQPAVDLTARLKPGLQGNQIVLSRVAVPAGIHPIRVSVRDTEGREGALTFMLRAR